MQLLLVQMEAPVPIMSKRENLSALAHVAIKATGVVISSDHATIIPAKMEHAVSQKRTLPMERLCACVRLGLLESFVSHLLTEVMDICNH